MSRTINVLIVDDHQLIRQSLAAMLGQDHGISVVGEAGDAASALRRLREHNVEVAILDVSLPGTSGVELARRLVTSHPEVKVIALSAHKAPAHVSGMLKAGASGYVLKSARCTELIDAVHTVTKGHMYLSPEITRGVVEDYRELLALDTSSPIARLSDREREVAVLIAEGKSTREIGALLSISPKTVATHRKHVMDILGVRGVADLTRLAIKENLITLDP